MIKWNEIEDETEVEVEDVIERIRIKVELDKGMKVKADAESEFNNDEGSRVEKIRNWTVFHVANVEVGALIRVSWVIIWVEYIHSEYFSHNKCETNFAEIN